MKKLLLFVCSAVLLFAACRSYDPAVDNGEINPDLIVSTVGDGIPDGYYEGEKLVIYIAHEKWGYKNKDDFYGSPYGYYVRFDEDGYWENTRIPIVEFNYQRGYEYQVEVRITNRIIEDGKEEVIYQWLRTIDKLKRK